MAIDIDELRKAKTVRFKDLLRLCINYFGEPRINGSHHIFKMPWAGDPRINLQKDGKEAKTYQVRDVIRAIDRLLDEGGERE